MTGLPRVELPADEREGVEASLRAVDFLDAEVARLDVVLAGAVLASPDMRRLMTLPGVSATTAATLAAVIGDVRRFPARRCGSAAPKQDRAEGDDAHADEPDQDRCREAGRIARRTGGRRP